MKRVGPLYARAACRLLALLLACVSPHVGAWNQEGHRAVAQIASAYVSAAARHEIERLLGEPISIALPRQAPWADAIIASRPETRPWHYVNIPRRADGLDHDRDCVDGNCVVGALDLHWHRLRDRSLPDADRREALQFLIHFVGDLHQPLHCGDGGDRGGNDIAIEVNGVRSNLHRLWDGEFFSWSSLAATDEAVESTSEPTAPWSPEFWDLWAGESHRIAVQDIYARLPRPRPDRVSVISDTEIRRYWQIAHSQIHRAARRLAHALNTALP